MLKFFFCYGIIYYIESGDSMFNKLKYLLFIIILFPSTVFAVSLDKTKIDLYYDSDSYQDLITKPSEYLDEDQITVNGDNNVNYSIS